MTDDCEVQLARLDLLGQGRAVAFEHVHDDVGMRLDEARQRFDRLLSRRNHLGLLSEDISPTTGELWGNFPQTYSMVGIIGSALRLSRSWEEIV